MGSPFDPPVKKKKKGSRFHVPSIPGRGFVRRTVKDFGDIASGAPAGAFLVGKQAGLASADVVRGDYLKAGKRIYKINRQQVKDTKETIRHPLRHPGYTFVTALGLAAPVARGISAGAAGARLGTVAARTARINNLDRVGSPAFGGGRTLRGAGGKFQRTVKGRQLKKTARSVPGRESVVKETVKGVRQGIKENRKPRTRTISYTPKTVEEAKTLQRHAFEMPQWKKDANILNLKNKKPAKYPIPATLQASDQPITRAAERLRDKSRTQKGVRSKVQKTFAYEADVRGRLQDSQNAPGTIQSLRSLSPKKVRAAKAAALKKGEKPPSSPYSALREKPLSEGMGEVNALVRALRLYRLGYIPANWLGAQATNLIHYGPRQHARLVRGQHTLRKSDKDTAAALDRLQGETAGQALGDTGHTGPTSTLMRGVGTSLGKVTDRAARSRALLRETERQDVETKNLPSVLRKARMDDPEALRAIINATTRGEKAAIKFTRSRPIEGVKEGHLSKADRLLARNIFLYKWITGSGAYSARMLAERPTTSAFLAQLGQQGPDISDLLKEYPEFMERYIPVGKGRVSNPQATSLFDMPGDVFKNFYKSINGEPLAALENLNPVPHAAVTALSAKDIFRGQELSDDDKNSLRKRLEFALETELRSIPYRKILPTKLGGRIGESGEENRLFPMSDWEIALQFALGSGFPTKVNPKVAKKMHGSEKHGKKKPSRRSPFDG